MGHEAYLCCLTICRLLLLGSVEFFVALHIRQSKTRLTDSHTA